MDVGGLFRLAKRRDGAAVPWALRAREYEFFTDSNGYPCQKPPWGTLTAIDLDTGTFRWQSVLGELEELARRGVEKTGAPNIGGSIVTEGGLVFIAATSDRKVRAFDRDTGRELWSHALPASGFARPAFYRGKEGRPFVVIAAGGGNKYDKVFSGKVVAFSLPETRGYVPREERLPGPVVPQPVAFSHRVHAERAGLDCLDCHEGATRGDAATLPGAEACMTCHGSIRAESAEVAKVRRAAATGEGLSWARVYTLPDIVFFGHREHVAAGTRCAECHGPVATRDALRKEVSTGMNACLDCHRQRQAPVHCAACHILGH
jgi:hypothetical protein